MAFDRPLYMPSYLRRWPAHPVGSSAIPSCTASHAPLVPISAHRRRQALLPDAPMAPLPAPAGRKEEEGLLLAEASCSGCCLSHQFQRPHSAISARLSGLAAANDTAVVSPSSRISGHAALRDFGTSGGEPGGSDSCWLYLLRHRGLGQRGPPCISWSR